MGWLLLLYTGSEEQPLRSKTLTLDDLMKRKGLMDSCIDQEISNEDMCSIASLFKNVNCLLDKFGLLPNKQTDIEIISRHNTAEATKEALKVWWQQNPYHATVFLCCCFHTIC